MKVVPRLALVMACLGSTSAVSLVCSRAVTPVETTICHDPSLLQLDEGVGRLYGQVRNATIDSARVAIQAQQRAWIAHRDMVCKSGDPACLTARYEERRDQLQALAAASIANGDHLESVIPVVLRGVWEAAPILDLSRSSAASSAADVRHDLDTAGLPRVGDRIRTGPGRFCIADQPCESVGWSATTVGDLQGGERIAQDLKLPMGTRAYTGGTGSPASLFILVPGSDHHLLAVFGLCDPGATNCRNGYEPWSPASPDARIE